MLQVDHKNADGVRNAGDVILVSMVMRTLFTTLQCQNGSIPVRVTVDYGVRPDYLETFEDISYLTLSGNSITTVNIISTIGSFEYSCLIQSTSFP